MSSVKKYVKYISVRRIKDKNYREAEAKKQKLDITIIPYFTFRAVRRENKNDRE